MNNKKGFILSTYVYMLLVFFLLLLTTMLTVMNNSKLLSNKLKEQSSNTSGLTDKDYSFILLGESDMIIRKGEEYIEPGFKIQTVKGVDLSDIVSITGDVDVNLPNTYKLTYSATYNGITKRLTRNVTVLDNTASNYIAGLYNYRRDENNLINPKVIYEGKEYDTGIRYTGADPNNYVFFNCEDKDNNNISYGEDNYDYVSSCEVWRIIGVFDTKSSVSSDAVPRVKIINTASTFKASWDSSASSINSGWGINEWSQSDLKSLLNGYYIGKEGAACTYCNGSGQASCEQSCTSESLKSAKMQPLTTTAKRMIGNAVWDMYGVSGEDMDWSVTSGNASSAYLQEKGISAQNNGKNLCVDAHGSNYSDCNDSVERTTSWEGLVGLMSVVDIEYADGWLYDQSDNSLYPWSISPNAHSSYARVVWRAYDGNASYDSAAYQGGVFASVYLNSNIQIIGGNGNTEPYKLK